jgi:gamma-butyrobetaine dioxygenase
MNATQPDESESQFSASFERLILGSELLALLDEIADHPYMNEAVDQRTHALQTAELAAAAHADDELIIAAALHDIGRAGSVRSAYPELAHEEAGGVFVRTRATSRMAWIIEQHVPAKRYLVACDPDYSSKLSPTSVKTLARQGGPMSQVEVERFRQHPWHDAALTLRRWDDAAKDPERVGMSIPDLLETFERWKQQFRTARP